MAASAGAWASTPATAARPILDRPCSPDGSSKRGCPSSLHVEKWMWKPEPPSSLKGLAMNVAILSFCRASSLIGVLEAERPVGRGKRVGVPQVDLELPAGELVVGGHDVQAVGGQLAQGAQQGVLRVTLETGDVDVARGLAVAPPAVRRARVALEDEELELRPDHRAHPELGELVDHPTQHAARVLLRRGAVRVEDVGDAVGDAGLPRHRLHRGEVREGDDVRETRLDAALDVAPRHPSASCRRPSGRTQRRRRRCGRTG